MGVWVWGLFRRALSAKKKRYKYVTMLFGRETVWMNLLVWKETRRCRCVRDLKKGKWDSVCAKRRLDGQL